MKVEFKLQAAIAFFICLFATTLFGQTSWLDHYYTAPNGWSVYHHVRTTGDVNGDGKDDIVGFGNDGVFVAFSNGKGFKQPTNLLNNFAKNAGNWDVQRNPRVMGDVNGDGQGDIVGFGSSAVLVVTNIKQLKKTAGK